MQSRKKKATPVKVKKILVPTDFSTAARAAFRHALAMAKETPTEIILLHVVAPSESRDRDRTLNVARKKLDEFCQSKGGESNRCQTVVRAGIPFVEITQRARELGADLIVLGRPDQTGSASFGDGHTLDRVARYATCPVLLVRETDGNIPAPALRDFSYHR
jgi:nucleotide-binding universal stress UspA family protein